MRANDRPKLTAREAALVEAARRELAAHAPAGPAPAAGSGGGPESAPAIEQPVPPPPQDPAPVPLSGTAARIAALMQAEAEASLQRNRRVRRYAIWIPAAVLIAATLWLLAAISRYGGFW